MDTNQISNTFSKGSVVFSDNLVVVIYPASKNWVTQTVWEGDNQSTFESLLSRCRVFRVSMSVADGLRLVFEFDKTVSDGTIYCQPREQSVVTLDEMKKRIAVVEGSDDAKDFFKSFFADVDIDDEAEVSEAFLRFLDAYDKHYDTGISNLKTFQAWNRLKGKSDTFRRFSGFCEVESYPPERYSNGCGSISYVYECRNKRSIRFSGEAKSALLELIQVSNGVQMEFGKTGDGFAFNMSLAVG